MSGDEPAPLRFWRVRLRHDRGLVSIEMTGTSERQVRDTIMKIEGCPERSIVSVDDLGPVLKTADQLALPL